MLTIHITNVYDEVSMLKSAFADLKVSFFDPYVRNHRFVKTIDIKADYAHNDFTLKFSAFSTGDELRFLYDLYHHFLYHAYSDGTKRCAFLIKSYRNRVF